MNAGLFFAYCRSGGLIDRAVIKKIAHCVDRFFDIYAHVNLILGFVLPIGTIVLLVVIVFFLLKQSRN